MRLSSTPRGNGHTRSSGVRSTHVDYGMTASRILAKYLDCPEAITILRKFFPRECDGFAYSKRSISACNDQRKMRPHFSWDIGGRDNSPALYVVPGGYRAGDRIMIAARCHYELAASYWSSTSDVYVSFMLPCRAPSKFESRYWNMNLRVAVPPPLTLWRNVQFPERA